MSDAAPGSRTLSTRVAAALLAAFVAALTLSANASFLVDEPDDLRFFPPYVEGFDANANRHLGAEYWNIARALAAGRGFADPFGVASGPTAWMPPVYPALLAALYAATGSEPAVVAIILAAKGTVLVATGLLIFGAARRSARRLRPEWALAAYALWITAHFDWFFQITHDVWLLLGLVDAALFAAWRLLERGIDTRRAAAFGALGGFTALASPTLGAAWGALALTVCWRRRAWRPLAVSVAVSVVLVMPWIARNQAVLGEWLLVKSNLAYDLYQANYKSPDGVYDEPFLLQHPVWTTLRRPDSLYRTQGEGAFLAAYREKWRAALHADPGAVARRAAHRALAATLVYKPYRPRTEGRHPPLRTALHPLPFLGLVVLLVAWRGRPPEPIAATLALYAAALAPYVLAAYYLRYLLPLTPALVLFAFLGADALAAAALRERPPR
jgi:hypothetical protein